MVVTVTPFIVNYPGGRGGTWVFRGAHRLVIKIKKYPGGGGGGGGGALRYRGWPHPRYIFRGRRVFFKTSACPRFWVKIPLQSTKYTRL